MQQRSMWHACLVPTQIRHDSTAEASLLPHPVRVYFGLLEGIFLVTLDFSINSKPGTAVVSWLIFLQAHATVRPLAQSV